jgi:uncharacterized membrane protein
MEFILPLLGRFHPLFVHLPIGILLFGILLVFIPSKTKAAFLPSIRIAFLVGFIVGLMSAISGFLQYQNEGYTWETVQIHLILGWITVIFSLGLYFQFRRTQELTQPLKIQSGLIFLFITLTGHFGGNITHGEDYFLEVLPPGLLATFGIETHTVAQFSLEESSWEEVLFYDGAIQPILNYNCSSCHNPRNLKGELDLSTIKGLMQGGENGEVLKVGDLAESALYTRLILPHANEEHMPPTEKRQPKKEEVELIKLWIETGASNDKTLAQAAVKRIAVQSFFRKEENPFFPITDLKPVSSDTLSILREKGFFVEQISADNSLLRVSCLNFLAFSEEDWNSLKGISEHIAYLDLSDTKASESIIDSISGLRYLTTLKLNGIEMEGKGLEKLKDSKNLKLLYLNSTELTLENLTQLDGHPSLEKVYIFKTPASGQGKRNFSFHLETGDFLLPKLASDTIVY